MERPVSFDDIVGHDWLVQYLCGHIENGTLHHFLILEGPEGLGKTSLADLVALDLVYGTGQSAEKTEAYKSVVKKKVSNEYIKKFELSVDGGKDVAKEVRSEMKSVFNKKKNKVIICDESHNLSEAAQDVFLAETEYISDNIYIILLTTEADKLKASLKSRAVPIHLNPLKQSDMISVLKKEVLKKHLVIQNEDITLGLIADWSECKPRTGLNILNAFSDGSSVSMSAIRELIGYMDIKDIIPLLASLSGSMTFGLNYISEMTVHNSIVSLVIECIKVASGSGSYKIRMSDMSYVKDQLSTVDTSQLVKFLYGITKHNKLTRTDIINAYISAHVMAKEVTKADTSELLGIEQSQKAEVVSDLAIQASAKAPTLADLMMDSAIVGGTN